MHCFLRCLRFYLHICLATIWTGFAHVLWFSHSLAHVLTGIDEFHHEFCTHNSCWILSQNSQGSNMWVLKTPIPKGAMPCALDAFAFWIIAFKNCMLCNHAFRNDLLPHWLACCHLRSFAPGRSFARTKVRQYVPYNLHCPVTNLEQPVAGWQSTEPLLSLPSLCVGSFCRFLPYVNLLRELPHGIGSQQYRTAHG